MTLGAEIRTEQQARAMLKLAADAPPSTWRAAFQREAKAAHPDQGGDAEHMRRVIEAYNFLKTRDLSASARQAPPPRPKPDARPEPRAPRPEPPPRPEANPEPPPEAARPRPDPPIRISIVEA